MSASATFGSFGDIITICIIIKDLVKALDDSRGSSVEYQEVIRELWALDRVLLEVELLWRTCESTVELNALRETAHRMTDQCRQSIEAFIKKVEKFRPSLRDGGSGKVLKDAIMKIRWQATHAHDLTKFRAEINAHCSAINMLLLTASVNLNKLSDNRLYARLSLNEGKMETSSQEQQRLLDDVKNKLEENNQQIRTGNASIQKLSEVLRLDWIRQLGNDLKTFMRKIYVVNIATYKAILDIRGCLPSHLERSLYQEPFILEDAIGRKAPVHMQFINSWEAFDSVLERRFHNIQGYKMVQNKKYVIQESATRREIGRSLPWEASFLPGQKVVMSMLFNDFNSSISSCPRCHLSSHNPQNSDVQCAGCGMWFRRIIEYDDIDPSPPASQAPLRKPREEVAVFGKTSFSMVVFGPQLSDDLAASRKRKREDSQIDDITLFKRVRLLSKKTRIRKIKQISGPFTELAATRNGFTNTAASNTYESITSKSLSHVSSQPPKTSFVTTDFEKPITESIIPSALSNIIPVPRTMNTSNNDDSDDSMTSSDDDSDSGGDDSDGGAVDDKGGGDDSDGGAVDNKGGGDDSEYDCKGSDMAEQRKRYREPLGSAYKIPFPPLPTPQERQLHEAINRGDLYEVLPLLDSEVDVENHWETTPLCRAAQMGNEVIIETLLAKGANVNKCDLAGWTGLIRAAENGDLKTVALLLSHGANVEIESDYGGTALQVACAKGHPLVVQMLLDHGAKFTTFQWPRLTEVQLAVLNGHVAVVRLLLERGVNGTVKDVFGSTLLHMAADRNLNVMYQFLLQYGADAEAEDKYGLRPESRFTGHLGRRSDQECRNPERVTGTQAVDASGDQSKTPELAVSKFQPGMEGSIKMTKAVYPLLH